MPHAMAVKALCLGCSLAGDGQTSKRPRCKANHGCARRRVLEREAVRKCRHLPCRCPSRGTIPCLSSLLPCQEGLRIWPHIDLVPGLPSTSRSVTFFSGIPVSTACASGHHPLTRCLLGASFLVQGGVRLAADALARGRRLPTLHHPAFHQAESRPFAGTTCSFLGERYTRTSRIWRGKAVPRSRT